MLSRKHLHPWLLVYLIATILVFLCTVGVMVMIIMNDINGFLFIPYTLSSCLYSTNVKLSTYLETILKICFVLTIIGIIFAMGQLLIVAWQMVKFRGLMKETDDDFKLRFEQLSLKKLIVLYILSFGGILTMVPVFGTFLSSYIEFQTCQQTQNKSQSYFLPFIVAGAALFFQIFAFILLLKLFYHFRQEQLKLQNSETSQRKRQREQHQLNNMKRRMSQSRNNMAGQQGYSFQNSFSEQQSPRDFETGLLGKGTDGKNLLPRHDPNTIYSNNQIRDRQRHQNSKSNQPNLSPNSISARQKQVMKTLPRHPFKKNVKQKFSPGDVIFQESQSQDEVEDIDTLKKSRQSVQTQHASITKPKQIIEPKLSMSQLFRQRYLNSPYLNHLENKSVSPQQRRAIKRPFLKMSRQLIEFDSRNYQADDISFFDSSVERKRSKNSVKSRERKNSEGMNSLIGQQRRKESLNQSSQAVGISASSSSTNLSKKASKLRQSFLRERSARESRNLQDENPISSYITQDQTYDQKLNQILQFQRLNMRRRRTYVVPSYLSRYEQAKQADGKLYLHKNKIDGLNNAKNFNDANEQIQGYDPFRDEAYDDQLTSHRGFIYDETAKNQQKGQIKRTSTKDLQIHIMQAKKPSRKDGMLLDFIRSKHVMD